MNFFYIEIFLCVHSKYQKEINSVQRNEEHNDLRCFHYIFEIFFLPFVRFHSEITPLSKCLSTPIIGDGEMMTEKKQVLLVHEYSIQAKLSTLSASEE